MNPKGKIIAIVGTRRRDTVIAFREIKKIFDAKYQKGDWIVSGGCKKGGDRYAEQLGKKGVPILTFNPDYKSHGSPGALFERNTEIAEIADIIIACVMNPEDGIDEVLKRKKGGTEDTLRKFVKFKGSTSNIFLV